MNTTLPSEHGGASARNAKVVLRGSFPGLLRQMLASVAPVAAAMCLFLFGVPGWRIFAASVVFAPVIVAIAWLVARLDRLEFDDQRQAIQRPLRRALAYEDVKALLAVETLGCFQLVARTHRAGTQILLIAFPEEERDRLERIVGGRLPQAGWRWSRYRSWRLVALLVTLLGALYAGGAWYFLRKTPAARVICEPVAPAAGRTASFRYQAKGLILTLPEELEGVRLTVIPTGGFRSVGQTGRTFLWLAGIHTEHDLFRYATCSRFGFVPLLFRAVLLDRWESARILASDRPPHRALAIRGKREGPGEIRLLVQNAEEGVEAVVAFPEPEGFDSEALRRLVTTASVHKGGERNSGSPGTRRRPPPYP